MKVIADSAANHAAGSSLLLLSRSATSQAPPSLVDPVSWHEVFIIFIDTRDFLFFSNHIQALTQLALSVKTFQSVTGQQCLPHPKLR
jgi:hypothetical protein